MAPSLPVEIWRKIFQSLCVHCQQPADSNNQIDFRLPDAQDGQDALRNLCLVSRECRALSQDILFHHFYNLSGGGTWHPTTKDRAPRMLRALISNPYLAKQVRMMALFDQEECWYDGITREDLQSWSGVSRSHDVHVPEDVTTALDPEDSGENPCIFFDQPGPTAELQRSSDRDRADDSHWLREDIYKWMYYLLAKLAPNLTHLQLHHPVQGCIGCTCNGRIPSPAFPSVRVLSCHSFKIDVQDILQSLAQFPNLDTFICSDSLFYEDREEKPVVSAPLTNLRKLSLSSWPDALSKMLEFCPQLEDLEFHVNNPTVFGYNSDWHLDWPTYIKANLRRLVWSDQDSLELLGNHNPKALLAPLTDFGRLEILEIDQASLLIDSKKSTGGISRYVLPESLRILHVAYAQDVSSVDEISNCLRELAAAKKTALPHLSIVKVDHPPSSTAESKNLAEALNAAGVVSCMEKVGIDLRFELESPSELRDKMPGGPQYSRCVVPMLSGSSCCGEWCDFFGDHCVHQCGVFSLEDLESL